MAEDTNIHTDQRYIIGIRNNDNAVIDDIYKNFAPKMKKWIMKNNGSLADAADIFQEALISIFRRAKETELQLTCPFEAYLFVIVRNNWFKEIKKRGRHGVTVDIDEVYNIGTNNFKEVEEMQSKQEQEQLVMKFFNTLGESCQKIIRLSLKKEHSQEEIANHLGISYAYLRKKKSECMAKLIQKVKDSAFKP